MGKNLEAKRKKNEKSRRGKNDGHYAVSLIKIQELKVRNKI